MRLVFKAFGAFVIATLLFSSCSAIRGERVQTGIRQTDTAVRSSPSTNPEANKVDDNQSLGSKDRAALAASWSGPTTIGDSVTEAARAFDFTTHELYSGDNVRGSELLGQGGVIAMFIQPGCILSVDQGPSIGEAAQLYPEVTYVMIHSGADTAAYINFAEESGLVQENIVHVRDDSAALSARFQIDAYPSTLLVDLEGRVSSVVGVLSEDGLEQALDIVLDGADR